MPTVHVLASLPLHFDAADFRGRRRFLFLKGATEEDALERLLPDTLVIVLIIMQTKMAAKNFVACGVRWTDFNM